MYSVTQTATITEKKNMSLSIYRIELVTHVQKSNTNSGHSAHTLRMWVEMVGWMEKLIENGILNMLEFNQFHFFYSENPNHSSSFYFQFLYPIEQEL